MRKKLILVVATLMGLGTAAAMAQTLFTLNNRQVASIPFRFAVGDRMMPAGTYIFELNREHRMAVLEDENRHPLMFFVDLGEARKASATGQLVFRHYGDGFFLKKARLQGSTSEVLFRTGVLEKQLAKADQAADNIVVQASAR